MVRDPAIVGFGLCLVILSCRLIVENLLVAMAFC